MNFNRVARIEHKTIEYRKAKKQNEKEHNKNHIIQIYCFNFVGYDDGISSACMNNECECEAM